MRDDSIDNHVPADERAAAEDLRSTGDSIRADLRSLATVEEAKRDLDADDPEVDRLSKQAVGLARRRAFAVSYHGFDPTPSRRLRSFG